MARDHFNGINPVRALAPIATTSDNTAWVTQIIDRQGYGALTFLLITGVEADADAVFTVTMEHGDDPALADTAVPAATDLLGTTALASFTFADDNKCRKLGYVGPKRYVRMTVTPTNNTGAAYLAIIALLAAPNVAPTPNPPV